MVMASALLRHTLDGRNDAVVGSAAADIAIHMRDDIRTAGLGIFCKQLRSFHDLTGLAVAALGHFFGYPGFLQRMRRVRRETFDRNDLLTRNRTKLGLARALRRAVDVHSAGAAETSPAAVFRAGQPDMIANDPQQRSVRVGID
jgi:hypothetical protein